METAAQMFCSICQDVREVYTYARVPPEIRCVICDSLIRLVSSANETTNLRLTLAQTGSLEMHTSKQHVSLQRKVKNQRRQIKQMQKALHAARTHNHMTWQQRLVEDLAAKANKPLCPCLVCRAHRWLRRRAIEA